MRRLLRFLLLALLLVAVSLAGVFAYAQTRDARERLARFAEAELAAAGTPGKVEGIAGLLPFDVRVGRIRLADARGAWLEAEDLRLRLAPTALLGGRLVVRELSARRLALHRPPPAGGGDTTPSLAVPDLPTSLPPIAVDRLAVERLELGEALAGQPAVLRLVGALRPDPAERRVEARLELARLDRAGTTARLSAALEPATRHVELHATVDDDTGLVGALLGRPQVRRTRLRLEGMGPPEDFRASLELVAPDWLEARAEATLALGPQPAVDLAGTLVPAADALPPAWRRLVGERLELALEARAPAPGRLEVPRLHLVSAAVRLEGGGRIDLAVGRLAGRLVARVADLAPVGPLVGTPLAGSLTVTAEALPGDGPARARLTLAAERLALETLTVAGAEGRFDLTLTSRDGRFARLGVDGRLRLADVRLAGAPLRPEPDPVLTLRAVVPAEGPIAIERVALEGRVLQAEITGSLARDFGGAKARLLAEVADLAALRRVLGLDHPRLAGLAGRARFEAELTAREGFRRLDGPLALAIDGLAIGDPALAAPIGPSPRFAGTLHLADALRVEDLTLELALGRARGGIAWTFAGDVLEGELALDLPHLDRLSALAGSEIAGAARGRLGLSGTRTAPSLTVKLRAESLTVAGQGIDTAILEGRLDLAAGSPAGESRLRLVRDEVPVTLRARWKMRDRTLRFDPLELEGPGGLAGQGRLAIASADGLVEGDLRFAIEDLAALQPWHRRQLAGRAKLTLTLAPADGRQGARLRLEASTLEGPFGRLGDLLLDGRLEDLFGVPRLSARMALTDYRQSDLALLRAGLDLDGPLDGLTWRLEAEGRRDRPFAVETAGTLAWQPPALELLVRTLTGHYGESPVRLRRPIRAKLAEGVLRIPEIDLEIGGGEVRGHLDLGPERVRLAARARSDLALLAALGGPRLAGRMRLELALEGPPASPRGRLDLELDGLRPADPLLDELPPAQVVVTASLAGRTLAVRGRASKEGAETARFESRLPLVLDLARGRITLPADGELALLADARADLATFVTLAELDQLVATGTLEAHLAVTGTVAAPELAGRLSLRDGRLEEGRSGLVLDRLTLEARAADGRITVAELRARDGDGGRLEARGAVVLRARERIAYEATIRMRDFRIFDNSLGHALVDGDLRLAGDLRELDVTGRIGVDRAEFRLAGLPSGEAIPELAVFERTADGRLVAPVSATAPEAGTGRAFRVVHDIEVVAPGRVYVRGRGLESEWRGRLRASGSPPAVMLTGSLELVRGYLDFLGRRLELVEGRLEFFGALPPEPTLQVRAIHRAGEVTVMVQVEGPARAPRITLASDPQLPADEILARLLFDRARGELTPVQGLRLAAALQALQGGGLDLLGDVRENLGLDALDVGSDTANGTYVAIGKYLSEDVYLEVQQSLATGETSARVEVDLGENLDLGADAGPTGGGAELEWRYDY